MSPLTTVSGIASGIDFHALADAIMVSRRAPVVALEARIAGHEERTRAYLSLQSRLEALGSAARALGAPSDLVGYRATIHSPPGVHPPFTAVAGAGAALGDHDITVIQLARAERLGGNVFSARDEPLGLEGSFAINGVEVTVAPSDSLDLIIGRINQPGGGGSSTELRASVVNLQDGQAKLVLSSLAEGAAGLELKDPDGVLASLGLLHSDGSKAEVLEAGRDALLRVDGVALTRSSNRVEGAIDGVTLTLLREDPDATSRLTVGRDVRELGSAIEAFVAAYNAVVDFNRSQTVWGDGSRPPLAGDPVLRAVTRALQGAMLASVDPGESGGVVRLGDLGISIQVGGAFGIDRARLDAALASDPEGVARLFELRSVSSDPAVSLMQAGANVRSGTYVVNVLAAATAAEAVGAAVDPVLSGVAEGDRIRIRPTGSTEWIEVDLEEGQSLEELAGTLESALDASGAGIQVALQEGALRIRHVTQGSQHGFELALEGNAALLVGLSEGSHEGSDVQGTVDGEAAQGSGPYLTVPEGPGKGLTLHVSGVPDGGEAALMVARGIASDVRSIVEGTTGSGLSSLRATQERLLGGSQRLRARAEAMSAQLEVRRDELLRRFALVEEAIARAQSQGTYLAAQLEQIGHFQYGPRRR